MSGGVIVAALGVGAAILGFLFMKLGEEQDSQKYRYPLQILILGFLLGIMVLLSKTAIDYKDNCSWQIENATITGSVTNYDWAYNCSVNPNGTTTAFYDITLWLMRIVIAYLVIVFGFQLILYIGWKKKGGDQ